ncbi:glycoside hydrolase family 9 protein [Cohnella boryungensis]|uniref:Endoglucanase n=1 Tax=Cohnella boryungensis TaxID=768479 RepID=A0ABV8S4C7_9BACL
MKSAGRFRRWGSFALAVSMGWTGIAGIIGFADRASADSTYNYAEVLQKSMYFYEAQRAGDLPSNNRVQWRGDSALSDGSDVGLDLTGGWYDAGDHVKFGLPMAYTTTMLAWSAQEYGDAYTQTGQMDELLANIKWVTDYLIKAHPSPNVLYGQVGNGGADHAYWGPPETMTMARPSYKIDAACPGSDLAGETAAALAASSIVFASSQPSYAATLLTHAEQLFQFADTYRGKYSDCIQDAQGFYNSFSGYYDELAWAGVWLYLATNDSSYLTYAENMTQNFKKENYGNSPYWEYKWGLAWDDKHYAVQLLLAKLTNKAVYKTNVERSFDYWTTGTSDNERIAYTPGGLAWLDQWGSLRYASNMSFLAFVYSDWLETTNPGKAQTLRNFGITQINYALGDNPSNRSYVVGFGNNPPINPHHRSAHGSIVGSIQNPTNNRNILYGALVGGPGSSDNYTDDRSNYFNNEVATDYNAGFTGAIAKMYLMFGGTPLANFPQPVSQPDEMFVEAKANTYSPGSTSIDAYLNNASVLPPRASSKLSFRYFVDLSELLQGGYTAADVTVRKDNAGGAAISNLLHWSGTLYYVNVDFTGTNIYPGDINKYRKQTTFTLNVPNGAPWNTANDPSHQGLGSASHQKTAHIPVYENGVRVFGSEPDIGNPTVPGAPTGVAATAGDGQATINWSASSGATGYHVKRSTTSGGPYTAVATSVAGTSYTNTGLTNGTTYYYVVTAVNAAGESAASAQASVTPQAPATGGGLVVQYKAGDTNATDNQIKPHLNLKNTGTTAVSLSNVKVRYYFTKEGSAGMNAWIDWAQIGGTNIQVTFGSAAGTGADTYAELTFTAGAGTLAPGAQTGDIQLRMAKTDWTNFNEANDYSFDPTKTAYADWSKTTLYMNGTLVWGAEP